MNNEPEPIENHAAPEAKPSWSQRLVRPLCLAALVLAFLASSAAGAYWLAKRNAARARAQWKERELPQLASLSITNADIRQQIEQLKSTALSSTNSRWAYDRFLLMTNGEFIVYASRHGANSGFVDHLFLGHASDGRWLYSTYHFCNSMCAVLGEPPPGSISEFAQRFSARAFDGRSDDCLQHTWP